MYDLEAIRSRFQQFEQGEANLSKEDLTQIQSQSKSAKSSKTDPLQTLISNFDKIDLDGNGMSLEELQTYAASNDLNLAATGKPAHRPGGRPPEPKDLSEDDLNQMISEITLKNGQAPTELQAMLDSFSTVDVDQDGMISSDEFGEFMSSQGIEPPEKGMQPMGMMPAMAESSKENSAELKATDPIQMLLDSYDEVDVNGDGISLDELQSYAETLSLNASATIEKPAGPPPEPKDLTVDDLTEMISGITSKTGQAPSELQTMLDSFDSVDTNQDGKISPDEFEAFMTSQGITTPSKGMSTSGITPISTSGAEGESADSEEFTVDDNTRALLRMIQERIISAYTSFASGSLSSSPAVDLTA
jgi:Ca2+-binding EF-hand superfamily protein